MGSGGEYGDRGNKSTIPVTGRWYRMLCSIMMKMGGVVEFRMHD